MVESKYEKFAVRNPIPTDGLQGIQSCRTPSMTYLSRKQVPDANYHIELCWIRDMPESAGQASNHVHDCDEILIHWGVDYKRPQDLGATIEFQLGGRPIVFNTTTAIFIPKGTPHGSLTWKSFSRPHIQMSMMLGTGDPCTVSDQDLISQREKEFANNADGFDWEQYVIRSPMREAGPVHVTGRQNPTMTYMSRTQVNIADIYIEFGWIWDVPRPPIPRMRHDGFDEIVLHIGSDPDRPEDLGGNLQFGMGEETLAFDTNHCVYIPKKMDHGPLVWQEVRKPLIEMAIMLGAGTLAEGWENSFFDLPDGGRRGPK